MTGVDFPYDAARFALLPKMPFPNKTEPIMQARMRHVPGYYDHYTMQTFVQACGRIVRAADDWGEVAVVDENAWHWYQQHQRLAPSWFHDAVTETRRYIPPMTGDE
jgi:Rad3-related DNA helicase